MLPVSQTPLEFKHRVGGVEFLDLPSLASGQNPVQCFQCTLDISHQGIAVDDDNEPAPENIPYKVIQPVNASNWIPEVTFSQGDQKIYTTSMRLSKIIPVRR